MEQTEFRPAYVIELYAAHVVLTTHGDDIFNEGYAHGSIVTGTEVASLMRSFGVEPEVLEHHKDKKGQSWPRDISDEEIHLYRDMQDINCAELLARVLASDLIEIKAVCKNNDGSTWAQRVTYSGHFMIAWVEEG
jgi:hypothetical protein